jgi:hypothetical protein
VALADGDGLLVMLRAYFDESYRDGGVFCVAGYIFSSRRAKRLNKNWRHRFGGRIFHAADVASGRGEFEGIANPEKLSLFRSATTSILSHASFGVVASCDPLVAGASWPPLDGFRSAYSICTQFCMFGIRLWLNAIDSDQRVAHIFEAGHRDHAESSRLIGAMSQVEPAWEGEKWGGIRYLSHTFVAKQDAPILASADLLAWEWAKYVNENGGEAARNLEARGSMRKSLAALLSSKKVPHFTMHLTGDLLAQFLGDIERAAWIEPELFKIPGVIWQLPK